MKPDDVVNDIAARISKQKALDPEVVKMVVDQLLTTSDPVRAVESLDTQLYTLAQRRAGKKK